MSLRARLMAAILLALVVSFGAGAGLSVWRAARSVRVELAAAVESARRGAAAALEGAASDDEARRVVDSFDGSRHVRAQWADASGAVSAASRPGAGAPPPSWFLAIAAPALPEASIPAGTGSLRLIPDPANEAEERWRDLQEQVGLLALFSCVAAALCAATVTAGLRPLNALSQGLARLGRGEPDVRIARGGPPEVADLAEAFNRLAESVRKANVQNASLQTQMATIAEEERTEIARDLHDEFGPLLFAIAAFAATIGRLAQDGDAASIPPRVRAIQDATAALQRQVRDMLGRLHEAEPEPADLESSLEGLIEFWRAVRPGTSFALETALDAGALGDAARETLFRAAQEAISNAVRHGRPSEVHVSAATSDGRAILRVRDDGAGGDPGDAGFGLPGMRARAAALGGRVDIERGRGWTVAVTLPLGADA